LVYLQYCSPPGEDKALIAMTEAKMLEKHGYEVVTVYNGEKAVEAVDSDPEISLILAMDIVNYFFL